MASVGNEESYETKKDEQIPVQEDDAAVEEGVDEATADSDAQLGRCSATSLPQTGSLLTQF